MKKKLLALTAAALLMGPFAANAALIHIYDFTYDGTTLTTNQSAAGDQLLDGDVVDLTLRAFGNDYWATPAVNNLWVPIAMLEGATRIGTLSWSLLLDGATVASGSYAAQSHTSVHIANFMPVPNVSFDELHWQYTSISSTSAANTLQGLLTNGLFLGPVPTYTVGVPVPEPSTLALFGIGFLGFGLMRRRRAAS